MKSTHTYAILEVSRHAFEEIAMKLKKAGYNHAFTQDGKVIDMHGIAVESSKIDCICSLQVHKLEMSRAPVDHLDNLTRAENWSAGYFEGVRSAMREIAKVKLDD